MEHEILRLVSIRYSKRSVTFLLNEITQLKFDVLYDGCKLDVKYISHK